MHRASIAAAAALAALAAVGQSGRDDELPSPARLHSRHTQIETLNQLARAERDREREAVDRHAVGILELR